MNYILIGAGVAGTASAAAIREHDPQGRIVLLGDEELPLYSRIRLPEYLAGRVERERLVIRKPQWYSDRRIDLMTGIRAESIDPKPPGCRCRTALLFPAIGCSWLRVPTASFRK